MPRLKNTNARSQTEQDSAYREIHFWAASARPWAAFGAPVIEFPRRRPRGPPTGSAVIGIPVLILDFIVETIELRNPVTEMFSRCDSVINSEYILRRLRRVY
ncbi:hypothetical protein EVAR_41199_1 [Eumeta japonica]|uniref:Uncharacterized protein n=1 Tax=Eumeta variegata TaxID=151549 RepID=A0A4C1WS27_EUMVA|nr:hypothetical protein EVAR_41199_1 [Eumeta japonica]